MIVRLKKRGELPLHGSQRIGVIPALSPFKGCCIEVTPSRIQGGFTCGGRIYYLTDSRFAYLRERAEMMGSVGVPAICEHCLIDDLGAFDSDFCDEDAKDGDLAFAQIPVATGRTL
jgi:hypothetical protein